MFDVFKVKSYLPYAIYKTIYDIDYKVLFNQNKKFILIDLDNTIIPYDVFLPNQKHLDYFQNLKEIGFKVIIISNNHKKRVAPFAAEVGVSFVSSATKPLKRGYKKALKMFHYQSKSEVIAIGDQLMTDVLGGSRVGINTILVKAIKRKSEKWYTRVNRYLERKTLRRIKKKHLNIYQDIMKLEE